MTTWPKIFSFASSANNADDRQGPFPGVVPGSRRCTSCIWP